MYRKNYSELSSDSEDNDEIGPPDDSEQVLTNQNETLSNDICRDLETFCDKIDSKDSIKVIGFFGESTELINNIVGLNILVKTRYPVICLFHESYRLHIDLIRSIKNKTIDKQNKVADKTIIYHSPEEIKRRLIIIENNDEENLIYIKIKISKRFLCNRNKFLFENNVRFIDMIGLSNKENSDIFILEDFDNAFIFNANDFLCLNDLGIGYDEQNAEKYDDNQKTFIEYLKQYFDKNTQDLERLSSLNFHRRSEWLVFKNYIFNNDMAKILVLEKYKNIFGNSLIAILKNNLNLYEEIKKIIENCKNADHQNYFERVKNEIKDKIFLLIIFVFYIIKIMNEQNDENKEKKEIKTRCKDESVEIKKNNDDDDDDDDDGFIFIGAIDSNKDENKIKILVTNLKNNLSKLNDHNDDKENELRASIKMKNQIDFKYSFTDSTLLNDTLFGLSEFMTKNPYNFDNFANKLKSIFDQTSINDMIKLNLLFDESISNTDSYDKLNEIRKLLFENTNSFTYLAYSFQVIFKKCIKYYIILEYN